MWVWGCVLTCTVCVIQGEQVHDESQSDDSLLDLISGYGQAAEKSGTAAGVKEEKKSSGKRKGGQK